MAALPPDLETLVGTVCADLETAMRRHGAPAVRDALRDLRQNQIEPDAPGWLPHLVDLLHHAVDGAVCADRGMAMILVRDTRGRAIIFAFDPAELPIETMRKSAVETVNRVFREGAD